MGHYKGEREKFENRQVRIEDNDKCKMHNAESKEPRLARFAGGISQPHA
jgi:hypothetical protein